MEYIVEIDDRETLKTVNGYSRAQIHQVQIVSFIKLAIDGLQVSGDLQAR